MTDIKFKNWLIGFAISIPSVFFGSFFKDDLVRFLKTEINVPLYIFLLVAAVAVMLPFLFRRIVILVSNKRLKFMRSIIKPGMAFGVQSGYDNVIAIEWSWINPAIIIAQTQDGKIIKVHYSLICLYI